MSHDEDSREARTLTDDSKGEGYIYERDISTRGVHHRCSASESADEKKRVIIEAGVLRVSYSTGQDGVQAQYRIICRVTL